MTAKPTPADQFAELLPRQRRLAVLDLCERYALSAWRAYVDDHGPLEYVDSVVGTCQKVDDGLPADALRLGRRCGLLPEPNAPDVVAVGERYQEPIVALQDEDFDLPRDVSLCYYAAYNAFRRYARGVEVDEWLIVGQSLACQSDTSRAVELMLEAVQRAKDTTPLTPVATLPAAAWRRRPPVSASAEIWSVFADWLGEQGSVRGEIISVELAIEHVGDDGATDAATLLARRDELYANLRTAYAALSAAGCLFSFERGFVSRAAVHLLDEPVEHASALVDAVAASDDQPFVRDLELVIRAAASVAQELVASLWSRVWPALASIVLVLPRTVLATLTLPRHALPALSSVELADVADPVQSRTPLTPQAIEGLLR